MKKALLAGAAFTFALTGAAWADIKIATAGPMTGDYATFGAQMKAGAEQAVADINAAGGVMGEQLVPRGRGRPLATRRKPSRSPTASPRRAPC